jgi:murein DD-endopeptidase MepM/ murein hydrolase activator NlpD
LRREDHPRGARRRFQHAHRIRRPLGALDGRWAPVTGRSRDRVRPGVASAVGLAAIALVVGVLRPWDGVATRPSGAANAGPSPDSGLLAHLDAAPSLGPHGDTVPAVDPRDAAPAVRPREAWPAGSAGPLPPELLIGYRWPTHDARITNSYGLGRPGSFVVDGVSFHDGIDVSSFCGARITAAHDGVVLVAGRRFEAFVGWVGDLAPFRARLEKAGGWGGQAITVVIDDGNGYRSVYAHLGLAAVEKGQVVRSGDLIGWEGASGNASGCHLHYALFSPNETATLALDPKVAKKTKLPPFEIARVDPLRVLPPLREAGIAWNWGAR